MVSAHYLSPGPHHTDRIQAGSLRDSTSCSSGASTGAYTTPELDPYSAVSGVSSFNYPAAADPTLLTPVSSAGSPPLQPRQATKPMGNYHQSQSAAPGTQMPTPPNTSKMYYTPYDINTSSQDSSPMTVHPVSEAPAFDMAPYMAHSPPGSHHHPSSPKGDVPPPIDPYLGHFTVSGGNEPEVSHHSFSGYPYHNVELDPRLYVGQQQSQQPTHLPVSAPPHLHHHLNPTGPPSTLARPHHSPYRPEPGPRIEDLRGNPALAIGHYGSHRAGPRSSGGIRKKVAPARKPSRTPKEAPQVGSLDGHTGFGDDEDRDELVLRDDAPEDDKYLFQLRKEFISEKGKGMWEEMKAKYSEKHQGNWEKAALQMKVSRAVAKFGVWPKREIERLREAHQYYEEKRYQLILARMKENGGCRVWDWKPQHIEAMLVKLGVEEPTLDDKSGTRRRKNKAARRRASQSGHHHVANVMGDWSGGLGLHHFQGHTHHVVAGRQTPFEMIDEANMAPTFTSEQENDYLDQIFSKSIKAENSLSPEVAEMAYDDGSRRQSQDLNNHQSECVARQACEQLMQQQTRDVYSTQ
ncbi:hypothetical protein B0T16DRAFT_53028 [Cercophora newfieldiana]|uniref:Uncharacterized protein n=1 Tax=Cercophora newfieldiana TaxID=92897 RepID=A0AA39YSG5_9PEZI|nr:hypothetical protein B0T16DRAFT_53028 [Cercophora newfieldiana]